MVSRFFYLRDRMSIATFHLTLMREALSYSYLCEVSPTAFSVGAIVFLPRSASPPLFDSLSAVFAPVDREGLILSSGYSRQIEGNTHAEANAINNLVKHLGNLPEDTAAAVKKTIDVASDATSEELGRSIFSRSWIYTTLEPCSKRTSGLRDCTAEIIHWGIKRVYMVSLVHCRF
jgi:pyrimidine deaminase RibD-like protein